MTPDRRAPAPAPARAAALIAGYRPPSLPEAAARFARLTVTTCAPRDPERAKALLFACGKLGAFASAAGLELAPEVCLHPSVTGRFIVTAGGKLSAPTRRTLRTNLRYAARRAGPSSVPRRCRCRASGLSPPTATRRSPPTWPWPMPSRRSPAGCAPAP